MLLDADYLQAALEGKIKIKEQIPKLLQAVKLLFFLSCLVQVGLH